MDLKGHEPYRGSPINGAPSHTFLPLGLGRVSCLRHNMRNTFVWMGAYKPCSSSIVGSWWRSRGRAPWKLQRICILWYLNLGLILPNNTWMVYAFFHVYCSTKSQENPKGPKFSILKFLIRKNFLFYNPSWIIFLKFKRQAIYESRISGKINPPRLSDFSKSV